MARRKATETTEVVSMGALALEIVDTDEDERGPVVQRTNDLFGVEIVDSNGRWVELEGRREAFTETHGSGRIASAIWARANGFVWFLKAAWNIKQFEEEYERKFQKALADREERSARADEERRFLA